MNLWDKKAKTYARYSPKLNHLQEQSFAKFQDLNLEFKDKIILDLACGSGVWSLHLAREAKKLIGVDSSKAMLEILNADAKKFKINNIITRHLSFEEFVRQSPDFRCDIAFLSMAAVLKTQKDFEAFLNFAPLRIYINWHTDRKSDFLEPIFRHFKVEKKQNDRENLEKFLTQKSLKFSRFIFDEERKVQRTRKEALQNALWHLQMSGINADENELEKLILSDINETIKAKIKLLVF